MPHKRASISNFLKPASLFLSIFPVTNLKNWLSSNLMPKSKIALSKILLFYFSPLNTTTMFQAFTVSQFRFGFYFWKITFKVGSYNVLLGGSAVFKCIPGVKLPKYTFSLYYLIHLNTPGNNCFLFPQKFKWDSYYTSTKMRKTW